MTATTENEVAPSGATIAALRESLCSERTPLPVRFRALFSLKHLARQSTGAESVAAIEAIAEAFASPSALLKHELAYCLGQTGNNAAVPHLTAVLEDLKEDPMCRHEAAEALGALGGAQSLGVLQRFRDREGEDVVVTETCEIAMDRIEWENSEQRKEEKLRQRCLFHCLMILIRSLTCTTVISPRSILRPQCMRATSRWRSWRRL
jgi:deoxyhypusine monooxygenase